MTTELIWRWQGGSVQDDELSGVGIADDGSVILAGETRGDWARTSAGGDDFAAVKLSADGVEEWRWQEGSASWDAVYGVAMGQEASVYLIGYTSGDWARTTAGFSDFTVAKISSNGTTLWRWQDGTEKVDYLYSGVVRSDGSLLCVGYTYGDWDGDGLGGTDFAAIMLDPDGDELWRWMDGTSSSDYTLAVALTEDESVVICGYTSGSFSGDNAGSTDMVVIKLSSDGDSLWAWQDGTDKRDQLVECVVGSDGSIYWAGNTYGNWQGTNFGSQDFAAAKLDSDGNEIWRWQEGTADRDYILTMTMTSDGSLFMAGYTYGSWVSTLAGSSDFAIAQLDPNGTVLWRWQVMCFFGLHGRGM